MPLEAAAKPARSAGDAFLTDPNDPNVLQRLIVVRKGESTRIGYGQVPVSAYSDGAKSRGDRRAVLTIPCARGVDFADRCPCRRGASVGPSRPLNCWTADGLHCSADARRVHPAPNGIPQRLPASADSAAGCNSFPRRDRCRRPPRACASSPSSSQKRHPPSLERPPAANEMEFAIYGPAHTRNYRASPLCAPTFITPLTGAGAGAPVSCRFGKTTSTERRGARPVRPGFAGEQGRSAYLSLCAQASRS